MPREYCSFKCLPNRWNQSKVKETVKSKYNVDNVFQLAAVKEKSKQTVFDKYGELFYVNTDDYTKKRELTSMKNFNSKHFMQSEKGKLIVKKAMFAKYGVDNAAKILKNRTAASKRMCENQYGFTDKYKIKRFKNTVLSYQSTYELDFLELC